MRAAVVGVNWGEVHVSALREAGVEVVALVGRDAERTQASARRLGIPHALATPGRVAELGVDLVSVATPAATHGAVIRMLPGDVPVLCEKPAVGLTRPDDLSGRPAPVWVNYAFAFLEVAQRAAESLASLGPIRAARVRSTHDLAGWTMTPGQTFFELVPHPWSWLVGLTGPPSRGVHVRADGADVTIEVLCGSVPIELTCARDPGLHGLRHEVLVEAAQGQVQVRGTYREGRPWVFEPPVVVTPGGHRVLGEAESGPGDPWYRANARAIGGVVAGLRGTADPRLFDWATALAMDVAAQEALDRRENHGR